MLSFRTNTQDLHPGFTQGKTLSDHRPITEDELEDSGAAPVGQISSDAAGSSVGAEAGGEAREGAKRGSFARILKTGSALASGQLVNAIFQLLLPPAFLHAYGIERYGEWLALSAGVGWLITLDFGLQAFVINQLSIEFFNGNVRRMRELQSVGLRISIAITLAGLALAGLALAIIPLNKVMGLSMSRSTVTFIAIALVFEALIGNIWGQLNGTLRAVGYPHRGETWAQVQRALYFISTYALVLSGKPLWTIPIGQISSFILMAIVSLIDLYRRVPQALPTLTFWDAATAKVVLAPSLWFGSFTLNQFLLFQGPIIVLNQFSDKTALVLFSICRTYFGLIRQALNIVRFALRPEITRLAALEDWPFLTRVFSTYQSLNFAAVITAAPIALLAAHYVLPIWTKRPDMFVGSLYAAMALATVLIVGKDTRLDLQYSTNRHIRAAAMCLVTYVGFTVFSIPAAHFGGATWLTLLWAFTEFVQMMLLQAENKAVLPSLRVADLWRLALAGMAVVGAGFAAVTKIPQLGASTIALVVVGLTGLAALGSYLLFDLKNIRKVASP